MKKKKKKEINSEIAPKARDTKGIVNTNTKITTGKHHKSHCGKKHPKAQVV